MGYPYWCLSRKGGIYMKKVEVFKYLLESNTALSVQQVIFSMCMACVLSLCMYLIYKKTYRGTVYSKNFNLTLILIAIIVTMVMAIIGSNLALSLGMVGSLSIIRFRTAIKEPRDIAFLFWAIAIGLSCGAEIYLVGIIGSIFVAAIIITMSYDIYVKTSYILVVKLKDDTNVIDMIIRKYTKNFKLRMQSIQEKDSKEVTYELSIYEKNISLLINDLSNLENVDTYNLVSYSGEVTG